MNQDLRRQARVAAFLIGIPSLAAVLSVDPPITDSLASFGGMAAASGVLAAALLWRRSPAARWVFLVWAALVVVASFYPTPQFPGDPVWSAVVTGLFAVILGVLGRQVWRVTRATTA